MSRHYNHLKDVIGRENPPSREAVAAREFKAQRSSCLEISCFDMGARHAAGWRGIFRRIQNAAALRKCVSLTAAAVLPTRGSFVGKQRG